MVSCDLNFSTPVPGTSESVREQTFTNNVMKAEELGNRDKASIRIWMKKKKKESWTLNSKQQPDKY